MGAHASSGPGGCEEWVDREVECEVLTAAPHKPLSLQGSGGITRCSSKTQVTGVQAFAERLCGHVQGHPAAVAEPSPCALWSGSPGLAKPLFIV